MLIYRFVSASEDLHFSNNAFIKDVHLLLLLCCSRAVCYFEPEDQPKIASAHGGKLPLLPMASPARPLNK